MLSTYVLCRIKVRQEKSLVKMYISQFGKIKFGKNIKVLITVVELQNIRQIGLVNSPNLPSFSLTKLLCYTVHSS